jgi:4-hydroxy-2-oxoheptanedioate aldolase
MILKKFREGKKTVGTISHMMSPTAIEGLGYTGLDYAVVDMEHSPVDTEGAAQLLAAARSAGITPLVRVKEVSRSPVLKALDMGAAGVIVPCVETAAQAAELVRYAKFAPLGARGFCPTRDGGWGFAEHAARGIGAYMQTCNRETLLILQCETVGCLESIETIASMDGVDGILIGPFDLSIALGKPAQFDDPEVLGAFRRILEACKRSGKMCIIYAGGADAARKYCAEGYDSVIVGLDIGLYINMYREIVKAVFDE